MKTRMNTDVLRVFDFHKQYLIFISNIGNTESYVHSKQKAAVLS